MDLVEISWRVGTARWFGRISSLACILLLSLPTQHKTQSYLFSLRPSISEVTISHTHLVIHTEVGSVVQRLNSMLSFLQNLISQGLAGAFTQDPNGNQADQRSDHLRTLENLDADVASVISEEIFSWVGTESKGSSSNHFGIREPEEDMRAVK